MKHAKLLSVVLLGLAAWATGACGAINPVAEAPTAAPTVAVPPAITAVPQSTVAIELPPTSEPARPQLRVWLPPEVAARTAVGAELLAARLAEFNRLNPDVEIILEQKPVEGQGGILSYLRTGRTVAPSVLPDLVAMPMRMLSDAAAQQLIFPLDGLIDPTAIDDLYPAARQQAQSDSRIIGYPFAVNGLSHLVYDPDSPGSVPPRWNRLIADSESSLVFPGDSSEAAMLGLQLYMAEGGTLINESGQSVLEIEPLTRALELIVAGRPVFQQSGQLRSQAEAWQLFDLGLSDAAWLTSDFYTALESETAQATNRPSYAPMPGPDGPLPPYVTGWAWAVSAGDPARRALASELLSFLADSAFLSDWNEANNTLPARQTALDEWGLDEDYRTFIGRELARAEPLPAGVNNAVIEALRNAVYEALTTTESPAAIAERAAAGLRP